MRILFAHNYYQYPGGEDAVVRDEIDLLRSHGHSVELLEQDNEVIRGLRGKFIASKSIFYSSHSRMRMRIAIRDFRPDILHVHNWFPILSPSIIFEADAFGVAVVQTLHNFRMICANGLLYRKGNVCTDCLGKPFPLDGILHSCYRGSSAGSVIVTSAFAFHRLAHTWDRVDLFIAVSDFQREVLVRGGLPSEKVAVKPNFVSPHAWNAENKTGDYALYVGRLSPEKGIRTMLEAWNSGKIPLHLKICGNGPMAEDVRLVAAENLFIEYLGLQPPEIVYSEMANARFLVFPSEWYETFGRTVIEAFSQGTPVLAADLGGIRELVEDQVTGFLFQPGNVDALIAGATRFSDGESYKEMRMNCRKLFLDKYSAEINYKLLFELYEKAIATRRMR